MEVENLFGIEYGVAAPQEVTRVCIPFNTILPKYIS